MSDGTVGGSALPFVSVILPIRNEAAFIRNTLEALTGQDYPGDRYEIVVADGRSTDATRDIVTSIAATDPRVRLIDNPKGTTPSGLNVAIAASKGTVIARMDGHAVAPRDYLRRAVSLLDSTGAWSVGGTILRVSSNAGQRANAVASSSFIGVGDARHNFATSAGWVDTVFPGAWPRWVFDTVGPFDEELVRNQDDEHAYRIRKAGGRIWFDPAIVVAYTPRADLRSIFEQYRQYGYWKVRVFQKHPRAARLRHFAPATLVGTLAIGILLAALGPRGRRLAVGWIGAYSIALLASTLVVDASGTSRWRVAAAAAAMHFGYGVGFWQGLRSFR